MGDMVSDSENQTPADAAYAGMLRDNVRRLVRTLTPREQAVVRLMFGLDDKNGGKVHTLEDMTEKFGVDRERIIKVEARALINLRQPYRSKLVECYISNI